ncbi:MAG: hypothetical protein VX911_08025 [Candidatus Latescibacterota bacterium]|nr:hypothetical protein [Candidatus Latescibacterota bacterium]
MPELERATSVLRARMAPTEVEESLAECCPSVDLVLIVPPGDALNTIRRVVDQT